MSQTASFNRMPRIQEPLPVGEVKLPGPPNLQDIPKQSWVQILLMGLIPAILMGGIYYAIYSARNAANSSGSSSSVWLMVLPMMAMQIVGSVTSVVRQKQQRKATAQKNMEAEARYAEAVQLRASELEQYRQAQRRVRQEMDPNLDVLFRRAVTRDARLWERRPEHEDFLSMRLGMGLLPTTTKVTAPHPDMPDPRLAEVHRLEAEYQLVPQVPVTASIRLGPLGIAGPAPERAGIARAMLMNLVVHHAPDDVHLLAVYSPQLIKEWEWLKWLPHTHALSEQDGAYHLANDTHSVQELLKELLEELHRRQNKMFSKSYDEQVPQWPWIVLFVEDYSLVRNDPAMHILLSPEGRQLNVTAVFLVDHVHQVPMGCKSMVEIQPNNEISYAMEGSGYAISSWPEYTEATQCERVARSLAPIQVGGLVDLDGAIPTNVRLLDMLKIRNLDHYDVAVSWQHREPEDSLLIPIGERIGYQPMILDLKHTGHGPHGLIAGTTGSGKSELVQTLVVSLALTHHPYDVGFVLVDFKGGGTFDKLKELPHALGMVTDLSGNLTTRALVALEAEIDRRKRLFNDAGVADIKDYQRKYWLGRPDAQTPLPRLVVIVDEFAELVSDYPDFMDGLISIARVGRSLGINMILATQSPAGVVNQQIWANAKFRICLRVEARQESMDMLHRAEAANLPRIPGRGYVQVGNNDVFELFQVARVAGTYHVPGNTDTLIAERGGRIVINEISPLGRRAQLYDSKKAKKKSDHHDPLTDMDVVVDTLMGAAERLGIEKLASPWPDALPEQMMLSSLLSQMAFKGWDGQQWCFGQEVKEVTPKRFCTKCGQLLRPGAKFCGYCRTEVPQRCAQCGKTLKRGAKFCPSCGASTGEGARQVASSPVRPPSSNAPGRPWLTAVLGLLDDPAHQQQIPLTLPLMEQDGQFLVIGAPGSGKDMLLRTWLLSLAYTHTPEEVSFYLLEFGGQALKVFGNLPHVGGIFTPLDDERIRRLFRLLLDSLEERKTLCNQTGVDGLVRLRDVRPDIAPPAIVVMLTGFMEFRTMYQDDIYQALMRVMREGGPYGMHVILVGDRAGDVPMAISSVVARRIALRLADVGDYSMVLGMSLKISKEQKIPVGRGWYGRPPLEFQTASPVDEVDEVKQLSALQRLVDQMDNAWKGPRPQSVEMLPNVVNLDTQVLSKVDLSKQPVSRPRVAVPLGLDGVRMRPLLVDLVNDGPDFIIASTPQGGKTTLLWTWALSLAEFNSPQQVQFVLVAGRRNSLRPLQNLPHVLDYCRTPEEFANGVSARLLAEIDRRETALSEGAITSGDLPQIVVMFDDYDEFVQAASNKSGVMTDLERLAKRGRDVELHTIVCGPLPAMGVDYKDTVVKQLKLGRSGFLLRVLDATEQNPLGLRIRASELGDMPPGRGYVVRNGNGEMFQVAMPGDAVVVTEHVTQVRERWLNGHGEPAAWPEEILKACEPDEVD
ncbi:MAG: zinc-ribbon domain-containing protein [Anaerolineae bacterium]|nr:zinc-ribbon domain-containing protein [Anaerolineae bacterium]